MATLPVKWHQLAGLYGMMASLLRRTEWQLLNRRPSIAGMGNGTTHSMSIWWPWNVTMIEAKFTVVGSIQLVDRRHGGGGPSQAKRLAQERK